jgi:hypothetical protein
VITSTVCSCRRQRVVAPPSLCPARERLIEVELRLARLGLLIAISALTELSSVNVDSADLVIGPPRQGDLAAPQPARAEVPMLAYATSRVGTRNYGTAAQSAACRHACRLCRHPRADAAAGLAGRRLVARTRPPTRFRSSAVLQHPAWHKTCVAIVRT